jgi:uncharacterized protein
VEIDAAPLRADPTLVLERTFLVPAPAEAAATPGTVFRGPVAVHARLHTVGKHIRADVDAHARCECPCDRCLTPVAFDLDVHYGEEFLTPEQAARDGLEGPEEDDGELRRVVYHDDRIELDPGLWQNLYLAMPGKHLCQADCRGLCPRCGRNLNAGPCGCAGPGPEIDPRLGPLAEAKRRLSGNGQAPRQGG